MKIILVVSFFYIFITPLSHEPNRQENLEQKLLKREKQIMDLSYVISDLKEKISLQSIKFNYEKYSSMICNSKREKLSLIQKISGIVKNFDQHESTHQDEHELNIQDRYSAALFAINSLRELIKRESKIDDMNYANNKIRRTEISMSNMNISGFRNDSYSQNKVNLTTKQIEKEETAQLKDRIIILEGKIKNLRILNENLRRDNAALKKSQGFDCVDKTDYKKRYSLRLKEDFENRQKVLDLQFKRTKARIDSLGAQNFALNIEIENLKRIINLATDMLDNDSKSHLLEMIKLEKIEHINISPRKIYYDQRNSPEVLHAKRILFKRDVQSEEED